jgi:erythromycin esterase-like protein
VFKGRINTWNLRDKHMAETLFGLQAFLSARRGGGSPARLVVWAHNSHLGDARATEVSRKGEWNVGQLVREKFPFPQSFLLGQTTYTGTVTAAHNWDGPAERKRVRPGLAGSSEELLHKVGIPAYYLRLSEGPAAAILRPPRLHRAIGVIYRPKTERWSHYFESSLSAQYDAVIHTDETRALEPLERSPRWVGGEEETYPEGL